MDTVENGVIVQNIPTDRAGASSTAVAARPTQVLPPPQPAQPSYISYNYNASVPPVTYSTYQNSQNSTRRYFNYGEKSVFETYLLALSPFGLLGAHHFYLQRYYWGILYLFTGGLAGCGYIIDWFRVPCLVKQTNENLRNPGNDQKTLSDAYTLWFPMGILGFHHYYLGNYAWGTIYTYTFGLFGIGWIVDAFRMPWLVRAANKRRLTEDNKKNACLAVALGASPIGVLGAHHYYLNRPLWGTLYTFTGALGGIGWIVDWFRLHLLIKRANKEISGERPKDMKTLDDAYLLWFPFGLLGFHHFYLDRPLWGFLYFFTLGIVGLGWLVDICRIPYLVREANLKIQDDQEKLRPVLGIPSQSNETSTVSVPAPGYPNYSVAHPVGFMNQSVPYPPQGPFGHNYQHGAAYGYPGMPENGSYHNSVFFPPNYYPNVYNGGMRGPEILPPPPYQPEQPNDTDRQVEGVTNKE